jgi:hypothetical protein
VANPKRAPQQQVPAWPLGCVLALLNLLLMLGLSSGLGILFVGGPFPPWLSVGVPVGIALLVPVAELTIGVWLRRGHNPYAGQAMLWGVAITLVALSLLTIIFDAIDRASGAV